MAMRWLALVLLLSACASVPDLTTVETPAAARADYPQLLPLTDLVASARTGQITNPTLSRDLSGRAARLHARAAALRQTALTPAERQRIREAVVRLSG
jgi:hypothetical protein